MFSRQVHHYSFNYRLPLDKMPVKRSDRLSLKITYPGMFLGLVLVLLGGYELLSRTQGNHAARKLLPLPQTAEYHSFLNMNFFDAAIAVLGFGIIVSLLMSYIRYKKIKFDGKVFEVTLRPSIGSKKTYSEPLKNYDGVEMRIEFLQFGLWNKNRYIIELRHKNYRKTIPLYISVSDKNIRNIWEYYAKKLKMPAMLETDEGLVKRNVEDLGKTLIQLAKKGVLKSSFNENAALPAAVDYVRKKDKTVIKVRKILWDAYNLITWVLMAVLGWMLAYSFYIYGFGAINWISYAGAAVLGACIFALFRKDKIAIKKHKIVIVHKFMLFSRKKDEVAKKDIEAVEVALNPASGRYFLSIVADDKTLIFGKKLSTESLKWVRNFLVNEIIKSK